MKRPTDSDCCLMCTCHSVRHSENAINKSYIYSELTDRFDFPVTLKYSLIYMFHSIGNLYTKIPSRRQQNPFSIGLCKMLCVEVTRDVPVHHTHVHNIQKCIFKLHCTQNLCNKIHVEYSNVPLSSRNTSCNSFSSHARQKHSKFQKCFSIVFH
jgi:hypothetical protein